MSATASTMGPATGRAFSRRGPRGARRWNAPNAIAVVLSLMLFGPLGLLVLAWVLSGRDVRELPDAVARLWAAVSGARDGDGFAGLGRASTGNVVFDDYQRTQHERIREIREEMATRARRFAEFRDDARRRADEEEFERFMASAPEAKGDA